MSLTCLKSPTFRKGQTQTSVSNTHSEHVKSHVTMIYSRTQRSGAQPLDDIVAGQEHFDWKQSKTIAIFVTHISLCTPSLEIRALNRRQPFTAVPLSMQTEQRSPHTGSIPLYPGLCPPHPASFCDCSMTGWMGSQMPCNIRGLSDALSIKNLCWI